MQWGQTENELFELKIYVIFVLTYLRGCLHHINIVYILQTGFHLCEIVLKIAKISVLPNGLQFYNIKNYAKIYILPHFQQQFHSPSCFWPFHGKHQDFAE